MEGDSLGDKKIRKINVITDIRIQLPFTIKHSLDVFPILFLHFLLLREPFTAISCNVGVSMLDLQFEAKSIRTLFQL